MKDKVKLTQQEENIILRVKNEKVVLRVSEDHYTLKLSGQGPSGEPGNGIKEIRLIEQTEAENTYAIYFTDGTRFTFVLKNGGKGDKGDPGEPGKDGINGGGSASVIEETETLVFTPEVEGYEGVYTVVPKSTEQVLQTEKKTMGDDVTITSIPYSETGNAQGGYTVTIGG